jgi:hypothetical protein
MREAYSVTECGRPLRRVDREKGGGGEKRCRGVWSSAFKRMKFGVPPLGGIVHELKQTA